jgi:predicted nucleic acid-binding protein
MVSDVLSLPGVQLSGKGLCLQALELYAGHNISFADAYTAAYMHSLKLSEIYSWDTDFDRLAGLTRVEPSGDGGEHG